MKAIMYPPLRLPKELKKFAPVWRNFSGEMKNRTNLHFLASPLPFSPFPSPPSLKKLQHKGNSTFLLPPLPLLIVAPLPLFSLQPFKAAAVPTEKRRNIKVEREGESWGREKKGRKATTLSPEERGREMRDRSLNQSPAELFFCCKRREEKTCSHFPGKKKLFLTFLFLRNDLWASRV